MSKKKKIIIGIISSFVGAGAIYQLTTNDSYYDGYKRFLPQQTKVMGLKYFENAINVSRKEVSLFKEEVGTPGVVIGVSVDGKIVWEEGSGYANVETQTPCHSKTVMRIASISKPLTTTLLSKYWEQGIIDMDASILNYIPYFPKKTVDNKLVTITPRLLASHKSGIRHYKTKEEVEKEKNKSSDSDSISPEFYLKEKFSTLEQAVQLFKDDNLFFEPGTSFHYTTHGYTLISAVIEGATKQPFTELLTQMFQTLGMRNTHLDQINTIINNRSSYYTRNKNKLTNAELTDNSYKWAGGGLVSTVEDLLIFGQAMLYSYQHTQPDKPGYLKRETVETLWTAVEGTKMKWGQDSGYGMGWTVVPCKDELGGVPGQKLYVGHGGGAVGASSVLVIFPAAQLQDRTKPQGVIVAVLANLENVSCHKLAVRVAHIFSEANHNKWNELDSQHR